MIEQKYLPEFERRIKGTPSYDNLIQIENITEVVMLEIHYKKIPEEKMLEIRSFIEEFRGYILFTDISTEDTKHSLPENTKKVSIVFIDVINSTDDRISVNKQGVRIEALHSFLRICLSGHSEYAVTTGDGAMIVFDNPVAGLLFIIKLLKLTNMYNKKFGYIKLVLKASISTGDVIFVSEFDNTSRAPWGYPVVTSQRLITIASQQQILVDKPTSVRLKEFFKEKIEEHSFGKKKIKNNSISVVSIIYKDEGEKFGSNIDPKDKELTV